MNTQRKRYTSDLTDAQWQIIEPLIPPQRSGGDTRTSDMREVAGAILYLNKNGCTWRDLPGDFPPHSTVSGYFNQWRRDGTWKAIYDAYCTSGCAGAKGARRRPRLALSTANRLGQPRWAESVALTAERNSPGASVFSA